MIYRRLEGFQKTYKNTKLYDVFKMLKIKFTKRIFPKRSRNSRFRGGNAPPSIWRRLITNVRRGGFPKILKIHQNPSKSTKIRQNPPKSTKITQNGRVFPWNHSYRLNCLRIMDVPNKATRVHDIVFWRNEWNGLFLNAYMTLYLWYPDCANKFRSK